LVGTIALQNLRKLSQKYISAEAEPPMKEHPGKFMLHQAERVLPQKANEKITEKTESRIGDMLGLAYGMTIGALYGALRPRGGPKLLDGLWFGALSWAAGFLGWLPATGLMPPVWKHQPKQIAKPLVEHAVYGIATVAAYDLMTDRVRHRGGKVPKPGEVVEEFTAASRDVKFALQ
jgi:hypothetical protein